MNKDDAKPIDVIFNRGVRQDLDPHTAVIGSLVACDNLEFDQLGRLVKRDGFAVLGTTKISKSATLSKPVRRFAQTGDGTRLVFADDNTFEYLPAQDKMTQAGFDGQSCALRAHMVGMSGIVSDQSAAILFVDTISVNGFTVYLYLQTRTTGGTIDTCADVIDNASGARVIARAVLGSARGIYPCRLVQSGTSNIVFALWEEVATTITYSRIDLGTTPLAWGAGTHLVTTTSPAVFDASSTTTGWVLAYYDTGVTAAKIITYDSTPASTATFTWQANGGTITWTPSVLTVAGDSAAFPGSKVHAVGYDPATFRIEAVTLTSALATPTYNRYDPGLSHAKQAIQMVIGRIATGQTIYAFSNFTSGTIATNPRGHLYIYTLVDAATSSLLKVFANYSVGSRFYIDTSARGGSIFLTARFNDGLGQQGHLLLLDMGGIDLGVLDPQPVCHFAAGRISLDDDNSITGVAGIADLSTTQAGLFSVVAKVNIGANDNDGNQIQAWSFQSRGTMRFLSTLALGQVICGGGTPLVYDGQRLVEESFYSWPVMSNGNYTPSNAGGSLSQGVYQYRHVWEWTDTQGNRHQSPASPAVSVDMSSATYVAGTNQVSMTMPCLHATRKQGGPGVNDNFGPVLGVIYRTVAGGQIFYRALAAAVNSTTSVSDLAFADTIPDSFISTQEVLYTAAGGAGLLASTAPPATIAMTTHLQRVWGVDMENQERIWCTRVLQNGSAAAYNQGLQVIIPGSGKINGLGGQDGKLYALATNGIYLASYGDGPDDTGAGTFPSPELITATANCQDPRGVLVGQEGIFFTGKDQWGTGIYQIRRGDGQPTSIGKRVRNELAVYPVCRGVVNRVSKARTEFLFVDNDANATGGVILYYHHDYVDDEGIGQWTVARFVNGVALQCLGVWDDITVTSDDPLNLVEKQTIGTTLDRDSYAFSTKIETADIRPAGLLGFAQISGVTMLGTQSSTDPLKLELSYDSGFSWVDSNQWTATTESAGQPVLRQRAPGVQKQFDGSTVRVRITNPTLGGSAPGATYFHGVTIEVASLGGVSRLDNARRA